MYIEYNKRGIGRNNKDVNSSVSGVRRGDPQGTDNVVIKVKCPFMFRRIRPYINDSYLSLTGDLFVSEMLTRARRKPDGEK